MPSRFPSLSAVAAFEGLDPQTLSRLDAELDHMAVPAGTILVREGDEPDALFIVISGRFSVTVADAAEPVAEIGNGGTIGEIAFFAGGTRTATCRAIRDSLVLRLTREDFDRITAQSPAILSNITAALANRLAVETRKSARLMGAPSPRPRARTIAVVPAGPDASANGHGQPAIDVLLAAAQGPRTIIVGARQAADLAGGQPGTDASGLALNALEQRYDTVILVSDTTLTPWSELAIRQADEVVLVGASFGEGPNASVPLNALERFAFAGTPRRHRLVLFHSKGRRVTGTRHWLSNRPVAMHHHAAAGDPNSLSRVWRFVRGDARGFVACGGGAYCAAHIGLYRAFKEAGITFDSYGGSSGGAAMAAAFAEDTDPDEISARLHQTFIDGKAMRRFTLPRYGLIDHTHFDAHMQALYGDGLIEDLWTPYFAVALDLTNVAVEVIRSGPVWAGVRASAAIPGLLPPYIDAKGRLLVDGSVAANVPIDVMHQIKSGPNVVVTFDPPTGASMNVSYAELPGRKELLATLLNPWSRKTLPAAPSAANVLVRTLMANRNHFEKHLQKTDWLLMPPLPADLGALDWRTHRSVAETAYRYAEREIAARRHAGPPSEVDAWFAS